MYIPQVKTPNSHDTLSRGIVLATTAALINRATCLQSLVHAPPPRAYVLYPSDYLELYCRVDVRYDATVQTQSARRLPEYRMYDLVPQSRNCSTTRCPIFSQADVFLKGHPIRENIGLTHFPGLGTQTCSLRLRRCPAQGLNPKCS